MLSLRVAGVPEHFNAPWHLALARRAFEKVNISVKFIEYPDGTGAMCRGLRAGDLDLAVLLTEGAVTDFLNEGGSKIIAAYTNTPLTWGVHVATNSKFNNIEDLRAEIFAISRFGSGSHLMTALMARELGWNDGSPQFEAVGGIDALLAAVTKGPSAAFLWEKFTTKPLVDAGHLRRIGTHPTPWPCFVIAAKTSCLEEHPEEVKRLLGVIQEECVRVMNNPESSIAFISKHYNLKEEDVHEWWSSVRWSSNGALCDEMLAEVISALRDAGRVKVEGEIFAQVQAVRTRR